MQRDKGDKEEQSVSPEIGVHLEYELRDELRGAFLQAVIKILISAALFYFAFFDSGGSVQLIGVVLLGLVLIGTYPTLYFYYRSIAYRW